MRDGFVSNSSSSSFVIQWSCECLEEGEGIDKALCMLFDIWGFDDKDIVIDEDNEAFKTCSDDRLHNILLDIKENTKTMGNYGNVFETEFYTSMRNEVIDYGSGAQAFLLALTISGIEDGVSKFRNLHMKTDNSGF